MKHNTKLLFGAIVLLILVLVAHFTIGLNKYILGVMLTSLVTGISYLINERMQESNKLKQLNTKVDGNV